MLAAACSRTPAPASGQASGAGSMAPAPSAAPAVAASAPPNPALPDGCWAGLVSDLDASASAAVRLEALAQRCAHGLAALTPKPVLLELEGAEARHEFEVKAESGCVRVLASGAGTLAELELAIVDAHGKPLHEDSLRGPFALAPTFGTVCLEPGKYAARVRVPTGSATVALAAYAAN
jgi:hypothetical protein